MPAPKLNKNALGNHGGAPEKYSSEWLAQEAKTFLEWMKLPESIFFKSFCIERGYSPQRLTEFASKSVEFSEVLDLAKHWQEQKLINFALFNKTNCGMTKFILANHHGYLERAQVSGDATNPLGFIMQRLDGTSKELLQDD